MLIEQLDIVRYGFPRLSSRSSSSIFIWRIAGQPCACSLDGILHRARDRGSEHGVVCGFGGQLGNRDIYDKFYMIF